MSPTSFTFNLQLHLNFMQIQPKVLKLQTTSPIVLTFFSFLVFLETKKKSFLT